MARLSKKEKYIRDAMAGIDGVKLTRAEAEDRYEFDTNWCDSDEMCEEYLRNYCTCAVIEEKEVNEMFYKMPVKKPLMTHKELQENKKASLADRTSMMTALVSGLQEYKFLFPMDEAEVTDTAITFTDPETGHGVTIKFSKHKTQKVVTKNIKRKDPDAPFTTQELRQMAIQNIMLNNPEVFVCPSFAGSQFGLVLNDKKYPFCSFKITHHKD